MSNGDKTRQKLMETMRKTKAGSSKAIEDVDTKQNVTPQDDKAVKKRKENTEPKKVAKDSKKLTVDPYQASRRVWPD